MSFQETQLIHSLEVEARLIVDLVFDHFDRIALLFSGGKDSTVLAEIVLAQAKLKGRDVDLVHIDTGLNFPEMLEFRDAFVKKNGCSLVVGYVDQGLMADQRNQAQSSVLKDIISKKKYDVVFGGGRRDEDKARQKELIFSKRKNNGGWDTKNIQFEFAPFFDLNKSAEEHFRVFPLSNWTEMDIWAYIALRKISLCSLYYAHARNEFKEFVRFRTVGDTSNSSPIVSEAKTPYEVACENYLSGQSERSLRSDDQFSPFSMEIRKKEGYF